MDSFVSFVVGVALGTIIGVCWALTADPVVVVEQVNKTNVVDYMGEKYKLVPIEIKTTVEILE